MVLAVSCLSLCAIRAIVLHWTNFVTASMTVVTNQMNRHIVHVSFFLFLFMRIWCALCFSETINVVLFMVKLEFSDIVHILYAYTEYFQ